MLGREAMSYEAKILADSVTLHGERLTTFEVTFPRIVLAEVNTHRMLSRSSASSRAIPVAKKIAQVEEDPFVPAVFGRNQKGMQAQTALSDEESGAALGVWVNAAKEAIVQARRLAEIGVHKQLANRLLEPFAWHTAIITATDWSNFWHLRVNPEAQGEFQAAAAMMLALYEKSEPRFMNESEWHLPLVSPEERIVPNTSPVAPRPSRLAFLSAEAALVAVDAVTAAAWERLVKISVARCARVSYLTHDGVRDQEEDLTLYDRLLAGGHLSPLEHAARPMDDRERRIFEQMPVAAPPTHYLGNFNGWVQHRKLVPGEADILGHRTRKEDK